MNIALADNNGLKFTADLKEHWESIGHEVRYERGSSEFLSQWADIYWVDTWDNNISYLYKLYHGEHDEMPDDWDNTKKPKIVVRALDWEVWCGHARDQRVIDWVDVVIAIAPHMEKELRTYGNFDGKLTCIRPGVNLNRFTLKTKKTDGFQIGMVLGDMWWPKNHMGGLDIFTSLRQKDPRWHLHIRGQHEQGEYWPRMYDHYLDSRNIRNSVTLYGHQNDMNEWLENIDILLHPGMKEAYCYAVGEALAKGIPCVVNNFYGATDIWGKSLLYNTHKEALFKIETKKRVVDPQMREYIENFHNAETMFDQIDRLLGL